MAKMRRGESKEKPFHWHCGVVLRERDTNIGTNLPSGSIGYQADDPLSPILYYIKNCMQWLCQYRIWPIIKPFFNHSFAFVIYSVRVLTSRESNCSLHLCETILKWDFGHSTIFYFYIEILRSPFFLSFRSLISLYKIPYRDSFKMDFRVNKT